MRYLIATIFLLVSTVTIGQAPELKAWDKYNKLIWADFAGPIDKTSVFAATTSMRITYAFKWFMDTDGVRRRKFKVTCYFDKNKAWSMPSKQNSDILAHEQTHFNINEFLSRDLSRTLNEFDFTENYKEEVSKIYDAIIVQSSLMDHTFDFQTKHGADEYKEQQWERLIAKWLDKNYTLKQALANIPKIDD